MQSFHGPGLLGLTVLLALALLLPATAGANSNIELRPIADGLVSPSVVIPFQKKDRSLLIADQAGIVYVHVNGATLDTPLIDLRNRMVPLREGFDERGLLGLALHPKFEKNRKFFVYYSAPLRKDAPADWDNTSRISEFQLSTGNPHRADPDSERSVLEIDEPQFNHNGGRLAFGPAGNLYISVGDGGKANDTGLGHGPTGNGQNINTLLGKILRIDIDGKQPYGIPSDNPFLGKDGRDEIYAYGLRNPWAMSFDAGNPNRLFVADVGQSRYEEVNLIVNGGNYGWNLREAHEGFNSEEPKNPISPAPQKGRLGESFIDPIVAYKNRDGFVDKSDTIGVSITGGYIYRGKELPKLTGKYIFADWSAEWNKQAGTLLVASPEAGGKWSMETLDLSSSPAGQVAGYITAIGYDHDHELYIMTNGSPTLVGRQGKVWKLSAKN